MKSRCLTATDDITANVKLASTPSVDPIWPYCVDGSLSNHKPNQTKPGNTTVYTVNVTSESPHLTVLC